MLFAAYRPFVISATPMPALQLMAHIRFGDVKTMPESDPRSIQVQLANLHGTSEEFWLSELPVQHGWDNGLGFAENGEVMMGQIHMNEAAIASKGLEACTFEAYTQIYKLLHTHDYPHCLRIWNFLAHITQGAGELERYRQFNVGRAQAVALQAEHLRQLPAATAIGMSDNGLVIYFLASRQQNGLAIENPRQVSAIHYPPQYGLKSPNFSRATLVQWGNVHDVYVSGTASVVGHETLHAHNAAAQLEETLTNIDHLLRTAQQQRGQAPAFKPQSIKFYLRDASLLPQLLPRITNYFAGAEISCLQGEICRTDLSLEIEAIYSATP